MRKTRSDEIVDIIGRKIVKGTLPTGETLPKIENLSESFGVSRTVVREALQNLSARGFVRSNKRSGTVVLPSKDWQLWDLDVMTWLSEYENEDGKFYLDMTQLRLGVEPIAAALAAKYATEEDREELTRCFQELENTIDDLKRWAKADYAFHMKIIDASHNPLISSLLKLLHKGLVISREKSMEALKQNPDLQMDKPNEEVLNRHRDLYEAIMNRDEEKAKQVMTDMILRIQTIFEKTLSNHHH